MIRLDRPLIVEGRYDKGTLASFVDAVIVTTDGFGVFRDRDKLRLIRRLAREHGVAILTDSDRAGFRIRGYLKGAVGPERIVNVYVPDVYGKEKRKSAPSKEGKLGVEGLGRQVLEDALRRAGVVCGEGERRPPAFTKAELFELGLSGGADSARKRRALLRRLGLPENMSANALCEILGDCCSREELQALVEEL